MRGYEHLDPDRRQVCWSHLQRDFRRHAEGLAEQKTFGEHGLKLTADVCSAWRADQHEHHDRPRLQTELKAIHTALRAAPRRRPQQQTHPLSPPLCQQPAQGLARVVDLHHPPGRRADQQPAERALGGPVIHRKLSHGTRTDNGERFAERALSIAATCRQQRRSLFDFLTELLTAHSRGDPLPALTRAQD
ncbi:MAG TPA: transposase [Baekduia sp.]|nr:transposase [Baekduia sp.]